MIYSSEIKRVLITGFSSGIGLDIAQGFVTEGGRVALPGMRPEIPDSAVESMRKTFGAHRILGLSGGVQRGEWDRLDCRTRGHRRAHPLCGCESSADTGDEIGVSYLRTDGIRVNMVAPGNIYFKGGTWDRKLADDITVDAEQTRAT